MRLPRMSASGSCRSSRLSGWTAAAVRACVAIALAAGSAAAQSPDPYEVVNNARATYESGGGSYTITASAMVWVKPLRWGTITLEPPREATLAPGGRVVLPHLLRNDQNVDDQFTLGVVGPFRLRGQVTVYVDTDRNGTLGPADVLAGLLTLKEGAQLPLLLVFDAAGDAVDATDDVVLEAVSVSWTTRIRAKVTDRLTIVRPKAAGTVTFQKTVDRPIAAVGDTLTYTLTIISSAGTSDPVTLVDSLPAPLKFIGSSLHLDGARQTDGPGDDNTVVTTGARDVIRVALGTFVPGQTRKITFRAVLSARPDGDVVNVAHLDVGTEQLHSIPATTRPATPAVGLRKSVVGDTLVAPGSLLTWRIRYFNTSTVPVTSIEVVDSLPASVRFDSASHGGQHVSGVVRWQLPPLAPGDSGEVAVAATLTAGEAGTWVRNIAMVRAAGTSLVVDSTGHRVRPPTTAPTGITLTKSSASLEAAVGEQARFTLVIANRGPAHDRLVVRDQLPEGTQLVAGSVEGVDSLRIEGRTLVMYVAGPVATNGDRVIRYLLTVLSRPRGGELRNVAVLEDGASSLPLDTAAAAIYVRRGTPVETRTIIGKVFYDVNDNGRQDAGERGVAGVQVLGADGEAVITDASGRFSFRDTRAGTHALRLDRESFPVGASLSDGQADIAIVRASGWTTPSVSFRLRPAEAVPVRRLSLTGHAAGTPLPDMPRLIQRAVDTLGIARNLQPGEELYPSTPLLTAEQRAANKRADLLAGPAPEIFAPRDGAVIHTGRVFIGVTGESGKEVWLYAGDSLLEAQRFRADGRFDFTGTKLPMGATIFRVKAVNGWGQVRWDSIKVYRPGTPSQIDRMRTGDIDIRADMTGETMRIRVLDQGGLPVREGTIVTLAAENVVVGVSDSDPGIAGHQRHVAAAGWLELPLKGGPTVGRGRITLKSEGLDTTILLRVLPTVRPLIVSGVGQLGFGATDGSFGALTARGALDAQTSVSVSIDSRRTGTEAFFARDYDALEESRYPVFGDRSDRRIVAPSKSAVSVRVERGFDWVEIGDVETGAFAAEGSLLNYRRALTGGQARISAGNLTLNGFGSVTRQRLERRQVRGDGTSGPYVAGTDIRPGTERVIVETRALVNASRIVSARVLTRLTDYEIDYFTGSVVLRQPLPSVDGSGDPVFLVIEGERRVGGEARMVGGFRAVADLATGDARPRLLRGVDSLFIGGAFVRDDASSSGLSFAALPGEHATASASTMAAADLRLRERGFALDVEMLRGDVGDSTALAGRAAAQWRSADSRFTLRSSWQTVGDGFSGAIDPRLVGGTTELRLDATTQLSKTAKLELSHERQDFASIGVERASTAVRAEQQMAGRRVREELAYAVDASSRGGSEFSSRSLIGKVSASLDPRIDVWVDGSRQLLEATETTRPSRVGGGLSYRITDRASLEGSHQLMQGTGSADYAVSAIRLKAGGLLGTQVWGGVERMAAGTATHNAVLGLDRRFRLANVWTATAMFERRMGLDEMPVTDPLRTLPFATVEQDRWSTALAVDYLPGTDKARATVKTELQGGEARRGARIDISADVPFGADAALLTRHDWSDFTMGAPGSFSASLGSTLTQRSIVGFAVRPTRSDELNVMGKLEWRRNKLPTTSSAFVDSLDFRRFIGAVDAVWLPRAGTEVSLRYALRYAGWSRSAEAESGKPIAHYVGATVDKGLPSSLLGGRLALRLDSRYLLENASRAQRWSLAPSGIMRLTEQMHLEAGWRAGELQDGDFGVRNGLFVNFGLQVTEHGLQTAHQFWQRRF